MRRLLLVIPLISWCVGGFLLLLLLFYPPSRQWPAELIYREDQSSSADAIIILMGSVKDRTQRAAELWKSGVAPKIVFVEAEKTLSIPGIRPPDGEATFLYLRALGVPEEAIIFDREADITSTVEEAEAVLATVSRQLPGAKRLILSTSWYHSSRALWIFERVNKGAFSYTIDSRPAPRPPSWYQREQDFLSVFNEYLKWTYYLSKY